jgi:hypothetical protein
MFTERTDITAQSAAIRVRKAALCCNVEATENGVVPISIQEWRTRHDEGGHWNDWVISIPVPSASVKRANLGTDADQPTRQSGLEVAAAPEPDDTS